MAALNNVGYRPAGDIGNVFIPIGGNESASAWSHLDIRVLFFHVLEETRRKADYTTAG